MISQLNFREAKASLASRACSSPHALSFPPLTATTPTISSLRLFSLQTPERIFLIMEHCAGGDLSSYIRKTGPVDELTAQHFMRQLGMKQDWHKN